MNQKISLVKRDKALTNQPAQELIWLKKIESFARKKGINLDLSDPNLDKITNRIIVKMISKGNPTMLSEFNSLFDQKDRLSFPSLQELLSHKILKKGGVVKIISMQINQLIEHFDSKKINNVENIAITILDKYNDYSLVDLIAFFEACKRKEFASDFDHITSKGITIDYILKWLKKYDTNRNLTKETVLQSISNQKSFFSNMHSTVQSRMLETYKNIEKYKLLQNKASKRFKQEKEGKKIEERIIDLLVYDILPYKKGNLNKTNSLRVFKKLARKKLKQQKIKWIQELKVLKYQQLEYSRFNTNNKNQLFYAYNLTKKTFLQYKLKEWIIEIEKDLNQIPIELMLSFLNKLIKDSDIKTAKEFMKRLQIESMKGTDSISLDNQCSNIARKFVNKFKDDYIGYKKQLLEQGILPLEQQNFVLKCTKLWINFYCYSQEKKSQPW